MPTIYLLYPSWSTIKNWWQYHLKRPPIQPAEVVPVLGNIQGHPKAPCLWSNQIHSILQRIGLKPNTHEKCLYTGTGGRHKIYLMPQVEDFAVASPSLKIANILPSHID